jgi:hypothetical protein
MASLVSALQPAQALIDPVDGVALAVEHRRFGWPLGAMMLAGCAAAIAYYARWDSASSVIGELTASGQLSRTTEAEIAQQILTASRVALIAGLAKSTFLTPLLMLAVAVVLKLAGWLFETRAAFARCFTAAAIAALPLALYQLVLAVCTLHQIAVTEEQMKTLVPSSLAAFARGLPPRAATALSTIDFFRLWSAWLLGLGFSAASGMRRGRAVLLGFALYAMYAGIFVIGLSGAGGGPGPRGGG